MRRTLVLIFLVTTACILCTGADTTMQTGCMTICAPDGTYECELDETTDDASCSCRVGYGGVYCQDLIGLADSCQNGGEVVESVQNIHYRCACPIEYHGVHCQYSRNDSRWAELVQKEMQRALNVCDKQFCERKARNGKCDPICNVAPCNFDNYACDEEIRPFVNCPLPTHCFHVFGDGRCDWECNEAACLYDGFDCSPKNTKDACEVAECGKTYGDGKCDELCNNFECGWDGGDCRSIPSSEARNVSLLIEFNVTASEFVKLSHLVMQQISRKMRTAVSMEKDPNGRMVLSEVEGGTSKEIAKMFINSSGEVEEVVELSQSNQSRHRRVASNRHTVARLYVRGDLCTDEASCATSTEQGGRLLSVSSAKHELRSLGVAILSIRLDKGTNEKRGWLPWMHHYPKMLMAAIIAGSLLVLLFVVVVLDRLFDGERRGVKRKIAQTWYPPRSKDEDPILSIPSTLQRDRRNPTPLHYQAVASEPINKPLEPVWVNARDDEGRTPLHWLAMSRGKMNEIVEDDLLELVKYGANVNCQDYDGCTPLHFALREGKLRLCGKLIKEYGASPIISTFKGETCLHRAVTMDDHQAVQFFLSFQDVRNNVDEVDDNDRTALALAATVDGLNSVSIARLLLARGADVHRAGDETAKWRHRARTALHWAAASNSVGVMQVLLQHQADVNAVDEYGCTPLVLAVSHGQECAARVLLEAHANTGVADQQGRRAMDLALVAGRESLAQTIKWYEEATVSSLKIKTNRRKKATSTSRGRVSSTLQRRVREYREMEMGIREVEDEDTDSGYVPFMMPNNRIPETPFYSSDATSIRSSDSSPSSNESVLSWPSGSSSNSSIHLSMDITHSMTFFPRGNDSMHEETVTHVQLANGQDDAFAMMLTPPGSDSGRERVESSFAYGEGIVEENTELVQQWNKQGGEMFAEETWQPMGGNGEMFTLPSSYEHWGY